VTVPNSTKPLVTGMSVELLIWVSCLVVLPVSIKIYVHGIITYRAPLLFLICILAVVVLYQQILICQQNHLSVRLAHVAKSVTSALTVTSFAILIRRVMGCAKHAALVGDV